MELYGIFLIMGNAGCLVPISGSTQSMCGHSGSFSWFSRARARAQEANIRGLGPVRDFDAQGLKLFGFGGVGPWAF